MHIRVCKREPGSALRVTIYIYIYIYSGTNYYTGVPLVNAYPCKSAPGKNVSLEEKTVLPMDLSLFFSLSLYLCLCFELRFDCVYRVRDTWFRGNELVERSLRENWVIFRPVLILRSYRGLFDIKKGV